MGELQRKGIRCIGLGGASRYFNLRQLPQKRTFLASNTIPLTHSLRSPCYLGGSVIFTHAGDDCTDIFAAFHPATALRDLQKFEIGALDETIIPTGLYANKLKPEKQKAFEKGYRELRAKLLAAGLFNSSPLYYVYKVASTLSILVLAIALAVISDSFAVNMVGAVVLGLFWQQCGWLAHDFLHHQVFKHRAYGDMAGLIIGDLWQGFSLQWWKSKHNAHHAVPNLHASVPGACDGDPDIDTMPMLAWTLKMAEVCTTHSHTLHTLIHYIHSYTTYTHTLHTPQSPRKIPRTEGS